MKDDVENRLCFAWAKLKAVDRNLNFLVVKLDFNCTKEEAKGFIEEARLAKRKVVEDM